MDILACGEVHDGVGAPSNGPDHFLDFFFDGGGDGRVADVGVDLHQEVAADNHRFALRMVDVGRDNRAAPGDFVANKFRRDDGGDAGSPRLTGVLCDSAAVPIPRGQFARHFTRLIFSDRNELHFRCDDAASRIMDLGHVHAGFGFKRLANMLKPEFVQLGISCTKAAILGGDICQFDDIVPADHPAPAIGRQSSSRVDLYGWVGIGAGSIVDRDRIIGEGCAPIHRFGGSQTDFPHWDPHAGLFSLHIHFAGGGERCGREG